jgi:hypothetical protein
MSRLKKVAEVNNRDFELLCDQILLSSLQSKAVDIGFEYNDGVFDLVSRSPEYQQIINTDIKAIFDKIKTLSQTWASDTEKNYPEQCNK